MRCYLLDQGEYLVLRQDLRMERKVGRQFSRWFVLWRRDYESAARMVRDMMGLLKNLLALTSLAVESSHFHKTENKKQTGVCSSLIGFVSLATFWRKWCGVLRWWYWCQQKSAKNWCSEGSKKDLPQEKLFFLTTYFFVCRFSHT